MPGFKVWLAVISELNAYKQPHLIMGNILSYAMPYKCNILCVSFVTILSWEYWIYCTPEEKTRFVNNPWWWIFSKAYMLFYISTNCYDNLRYCYAINTNNTLMLISNWATSCKSIFTRYKYTSNYSLTLYSINMTSPNKAETTSTSKTTLVAAAGKVKTCHHQLQV